MCNGCLEFIFALLIMVNSADALRNEHLIHVISLAEVAAPIGNEWNRTFFFLLFIYLFLVHMPFKTICINIQIKMHAYECLKKHPKSNLFSITSSINPTAQVA